MNPLESIAINLYNTLTSPRAVKSEVGLALGKVVVDGDLGKDLVTLPTAERSKHIALLGKTGTGKSSQLLNFIRQDVRAGNGFLLFDSHGDLIPRTLAWLAESRVDPKRVVLIDPTSAEWAVGLNPLEAQNVSARFRETTEVVRTLLDKWETAGAQTEELLRNTLLALSENGLTLLEVAPFLSVESYRAEILSKVTNADVREFFQFRFDPLSTAMQARLREPVLNKLTELTADPHFRYILGQLKSSVLFDKLLDSSAFVLVDLNKGDLGRYAGTLGALIFSKIRAATFRRRRRNLFTIYADEVQNLVASDVPLGEMLSESRKYGISLVTASQFLSQLPPLVRSALQAIGTHIYYQVSPEDAEHIAKQLAGGKDLAQRLANLPPRHFLVQYGNNKAREVRTPDVATTATPADALVLASHQLHARRRDDIERDILARRPKPTQLNEVLNDWE